MLSGCRALWICNNLPSHCCMEQFIKSDVCTAKDVPCQVALAKGQNKRRWEVDSSSSSQKGQAPETGIPLFLRVRKVGKLSCRSIHTKLLILEGTCTLVTYNNNNNLCLKMIKIFLSKKSRTHRLWQNLDTWQGKNRFSFLVNISGGLVYKWYDPITHLQMCKSLKCE